jgi:hypothetical protein
VLAWPRIYEVAILCGAAMSATWIWSLLRMIESPTISRIAWCGLWLGLTIAARPNLGVFLPIGFAAVHFATRRWKAHVALFVPLAIVGSAVTAYNVARYGDPFEFGHHYQLNHLPMSDTDVASFRGEDLRRFVHHARLYVVAPLAVSGDFPFVRLAQHDLRGRTYRPVSEETGGVLPLVPLVVVAGALAPWVARRDRDRGAGEMAALLVLAAGGLSLLGVASFWYVTGRYELDFLPLLAAGSVICIERTLRMLAEAGRRIAAWRAGAIVLVAYSVAVGLLLGLR